CSERAAEATTSAYRRLPIRVGGLIILALLRKILVDQPADVGGGDLALRRVEPVRVLHLAAAHQRRDLVQWLAALLVLLLHVLVARGFLRVEAALLLRQLLRQASIAE